MAAGSGTGCLCVCVCVCVCACLARPLRDLGRSFYDSVGVVRDVMQNHLSEMVAHVLVGLNASAGAVAPAVARSHVYGALGGCSDCPTLLGQYQSYPGHVATDAGRPSTTSTPTAACIGFEYSNGRTRFPVRFVAGKALGIREAYTTVSLRGGGRLSTVLHGDVPIVHHRPPGVSVHPTTKQPIAQVRSGLGVADEVAHNPLEGAPELGALAPGARASVGPRAGVDPLAGPAWSQVGRSQCFDLPSEQPFHVAGPAVVVEGLPTAVVDALVDALPSTPEWEWVVYRRLPTPGVVSPAPALQELAVFTVAPVLGGASASADPSRSASAYSVLLHAAVVGDAGRFVSSSEILSLWRVWDPVLASPASVVPYADGSRTWLNTCVA